MALLIIFILSNLRSIFSASFTISTLSLVVSYGAYGLLITICLEDFLNLFVISTVGFCFLFEKIKSSSMLRISFSYLIFCFLYSLSSTYRPRLLTGIMSPWGNALNSFLICFLFSFSLCLRFSITSLYSSCIILKAFIFSSSVYFFFLDPV